MAKDFEQIAQLSQEKLNLLKVSVEEQYKNSITGSTHILVPCCGYKRNLIWSNEIRAKVIFVYSFTASCESSLSLTVLKNDMLSPDNVSLSEKMILL